MQACLSNLLVKSISVESLPDDRYSSESPMTHETRGVLRRWRAGKKSSAQLNAPKVASC